MQLLEYRPVFDFQEVEIRSTEAGIEIEFTESENFLTDVDFISLPWAVSIEETENFIEKILKKKVVRGGQRKKVLKVSDPKHRKIIYVNDKPKEVAKTANEVRKKSKAMKKAQKKLRPQRKKIVKRQQKSQKKRKAWGLH